MKKVKTNIKIILAFILGLIVSGTSVYAATILFQSNQVGYDNTDSGMSATNVQDAIDELYEKANSLSCPDGYEIVNESSVGMECRLSIATMEEMCPNCTYATGNISYQVGGSYQNVIRSATKVSSNYEEFDTNYRAFIGFVLNDNDNDTIEAIYICSYTTDNIPFCILSNDINTSTIDIYNYNVNILNALSNNTCVIHYNQYDSSSYTNNCQGVPVSQIASNGHISMVTGGIYGCNDSNCID